MDRDPRFRARALTRIASVLMWCTLATAASAQSPGVAIPEALRAVIGRWCSGPLTLTPAPNPYFPAVRFTRGQCHNKHGDALTAVAAIDPRQRAVSPRIAGKLSFSCRSTSCPPSHRFGTSS
jgi:hypothetical protein